MADPQRGRWALIVHGGAKQLQPGDEHANREGVLNAIAAGRDILEAGGSAVDAVEAAIRVMEDLEVFNAGCGSAATTCADCRPRRWRNLLFLGDGACPR